MKPKHRLAPPLLLLFAAGACVPPSAEAPEPARAAQPLARSHSVAGLETVLGRTAAALVAQFGAADLDVREGRGRKLQFLGPACVLDAYLYPRSAGGEPVVTHIDARLPDGRDMDRASCIAALSRRREAR